MASDSKYTWTISDPARFAKMKSAEKDVEFKSPIFKQHNLKWQIKMYPLTQNGLHIFLYLIKLPQSVQKVEIRRVLEYAESEYDAVYELHKDKMFCASWNAEIGKKARKEMLSSKNISLNVGIQLLEVLDANGADVTDKYIEDEETKQDQEQSAMISSKLDSVLSQMEQIISRMNSLEQRMDSMQLRMDEEQKDNMMDQVIKDVNALKKQMKQISMAQQLNPEQQKLKSWLENTVKLPDYFDSFIEGGIDDLETVVMLTKNELNEIGINKVGHQLKILGAAKKLSVQQNDELAEGNTIHI